MKWRTINGKVMKLPSDENDGGGGKIMGGEKCCCEWIAFKYAQTGMYDCSRNGAEFIYHDPDTFCGTPFEVSKTNTSFIYKFNFENSEYCGGVVNQVGSQQGGCSIKLYILSPMTLYFTSSSLYNKTSGTVSDPDINGQGRGGGASNLQAILIFKESSLLKVAFGTAMNMYDGIGYCNSLSTAFKLKYEEPNPFSLVLDAGYYTIRINSHAGAVYHLNNADLISSSEYDMVDIDFSRKIPREVAYE